MTNLITIKNKYKIINRIANGKFGSVFKGINIDNETEEVAIKIEHTEADIKTIQYETKILNYLFNRGCKKHIPYIYWYGNEILNDIQCRCLIIPYYRTSLFEVSKTNIGKCEWTEKVIEYFCQCIKIIKTIHDCDVLHRDIKPQNLMIDRNDNIVIIDFGMSIVFIDENGEQFQNKGISSIVGTPNYISPFIHELNTPSLRDDMISLGYTFLLLSVGYLNWGIENISLNEMYLIKLDFINTDNSQNSKFIKYIDYCYKLDYYDIPDYENIINLFYAV